MTRCVSKSHSLTRKWFAFVCVLFPHFIVDTWKPSSQVADVIHLSVLVGATFLRSVFELRPKVTPSPHSFCLSLLVNQAELASVTVRLVVWWYRMFKTLLFDGSKSCKTLTHKVHQLSGLSYASSLHYPFLSCHNGFVSSPLFFPFLPFTGKGDALLMSVRN